MFTAIGAELGWEVKSEDLELSADLQWVRRHMDLYLMWDLNDLVRISQLGGYRYYGHTIVHTFARLKAVVGFGFTCGLITACDFDNIYWTLVQCQRRMEQEAEKYAESV